MMSHIEPAEHTYGTAQGLKVWVVLNVTYEVLAYE